jgi:hypothetical protein
MRAGPKVSPSLLVERQLMNLSLRRLQLGRRAYTESSVKIKTLPIEDFPYGAKQGTPTTTPTTTPTSSPRSVTAEPGFSLHIISQISAC